MIFDYCRQQIMPDAVSSESPLLICPVFPPAEAALPCKSLNLRSLATKERTDNALLSDWQNSGQTTRSRAPHNAVKDSLGLVGKRVTSRYPVYRSAVQNARKESSPRVPAGLLQIVPDS